MAITRPIFIISLAVAGAIGAGLMVLVEPGHGRTVERHVTVVQAAAQETNLGLSAQQIYKREAPGVVVVTDTQGQKVVNPLDPFGAPTTQNASVLGSGFVISKSGDILTNAHVVLGGKNVRVGFSNGQTFPATVVGTDPSTDVAVVKVSVPRALLHPLPLGNSSKVQPGSPVVAIGNPLGQDHTITSGIVSAVSRQIQSLKQGVSIYGAIQTDAAINHGNSGGPLIDADGQVIGITSQILTGSQSESAGSIGIGFAIPINTARQIAQELINNGKATHTYLGIEGVELEQPTHKRTQPEAPLWGADHQDRARLARRQGGPQGRHHHRHHQRPTTPAGRRRDHRGGRTPDQGLRHPGADDRAQALWRHDLADRLPRRDPANGDRHPGQRDFLRLGIISPVRGRTITCATVAAMGVLLARHRGQRRGGDRSDRASHRNRDAADPRDAPRRRGRHRPGATWHHAALPPGDRLLSFEVGYSWRACTAASGTCVPAADSTATPYAAARYIVGHADTGRHLRLTVTAREVIETDPATFTFKIVRATVTTTTSAQGGARMPPGGRRSADSSTARPSPAPGQTRNSFKSPRRTTPRPTACPTVTYRVDSAAWKPLPAGRVFATGTLALGSHRVQVRTANHAGTTTRSFGWQVVALPNPPGVRAQRQLLVSPAPRQHRSSDAVGLADRTGDTTPAHRRARRRYL